MQIIADNSSNVTVQCLASAMLMFCCQEEAGNLEAEFSSSAAEREKALHCSFCEQRRLLIGDGQTVHGGYEHGGYEHRAHCAAVVPYCVVGFSVEFSFICYFSLSSS